MTDDATPLFDARLLETPVFHPPIKRSVTIAGHQTSITLEPIFWDALQTAAGQMDLPLNALVARIDVERLDADDPPGLAGAIRLWLFNRHINEQHSPA